MRIVRLIAAVLGGLVLLLIALLAAVWLFVHPNEYKGRLEQMVHASTGRTLELQGPLRLAVFPWIALEFGPAELGNPPGFGAEPFASVRHVALRVKLLPLLHKRLEIGRVEIDGLNLNLQRNAGGVGNWQGLGGSGEAAPDAMNPPSTQAPTTTLPDLAGLTVKDARIAYQGLTIDHLNLEIGHLGEKLVVPVKFSLELAPKAGATALPLSGDFDVTPDSASRQFRFASLELRGRWSPSHDGATVDWDLSAPGAALDLAADTLNVAAFTAHVADARLSGRVAVAGLVSGPSASGDIRLDPLAPRELFDHLGMSLPRTRDAKALDRVSATAAFVYGHDSMRLSGIDLRVDDSHLSGSASIDDIKTRAASFDLSLDHLDADRYLDPDPGSANAAAAGGSPSSHSLRSLHLRGKLAVGHLRIDGIALDRVRVGIVANLGVVQVAPLAAELYGGSTSGTVTLDDRGAVPALAIRQSIQNIDVAAFLADFAKTRRLSGRGNVNLDLTAHGRGTDALLRSLDGRVDANLNGGAIEGIDLWGDVNRAVTAFQQRNPLVAAGGGGGRTRFDAFRASATLENGVASSRDLLISSQNLRVTGTGTTNLVTRAIDYQLQASVSRTPAAPGSVLLTVPVAVTGTLTDPKVSPDLGGIAKQRMRQELDQRKNELKKKLEDKLKDLFGH